MSSRVISLIKEVLDEMAKGYTNPSDIYAIDATEYGYDNKIAFSASPISDKSNYLKSKGDKGFGEYEGKYRDPKALLIAKMQKGNKGGKGANRQKNEITVLKGMQEKSGKDVPEFVNSLKFNLVKTDVSPQDIRRELDTIGRVEGKQKSSLSYYTSLPTYKIKEEDWKEINIKVAPTEKKKVSEPEKEKQEDSKEVKDLKDSINSVKEKIVSAYKNKDNELADQLKKELEELEEKLAKELYGDKKRDSEWSPEPLAKKDSSFVSPGSDTRIRNTTSARDPKDAKWVKNTNEALDDPYAIDSDDEGSDDSAAEAGKEVGKNKTVSYIKASSFDKYAKIYPELKNKNQNIISKGKVNIGSGEDSEESYYKILDSSRFEKVSNDVELYPVKDPYEPGSEEAKIRRDLEGMSPEEKKSYIAKMKGKEVGSKKDSDVEDFEIPVGKSGKPMKSQGKRNIKLSPFVVGKEKDGSSNSDIDTKKIARPSARLDDPKKSGVVPVAGSVDDQIKNINDLKRKEKIKESTILDIIKIVISEEISKRK